MTLYPLNIQPMDINKTKFKEKINDPPIATFEYIHGLCQLLFWENESSLDGIGDRGLSASE